MRKITKPILCLILCSLIAISLLINIDNSEDAIWIEKTRANIIVDINGNGDYTSIQGAVENATSGDTIYVREGQYDENIQIYKTLTLIGDGSNNTIIKGTNLGDTSDMYNVIYINANNVIINGFTVENSTHYASIAIDFADYCKVEDCNLSNSDYGITIAYSNHTTISSNNITNNIDGISIYEAENNNILNNNITDNIDGIRMHLSNNNIIKNNEICSNYYSNNYLFGVGIGIGSDSDYNTITNNVIKNNLKYGIYLMGASYNSITYNKITDNYGYGVGIVYNYNNKDTSSNTINNNNFTDNNRGGVQAYDSGSNNNWDSNYWSDYSGEGPYEIDGGYAQDNNPNDSNFLYTSILGISVGHWLMIIAIVVIVIIVIILKKKGKV